mgnify:CR=1 FL=1
MGASGGLGLGGSRGPPHERQAGLSGSSNEGTGRRWLAAALEANSDGDGEGWCRSNAGVVGMGFPRADPSMDDSWQRPWSSWRPEEREREM